MEIFLTDIWYQNKQNKQIRFLRQVVSLSGELVPLE